MAACLCLLGLHFGVEADELLVVERSVSVAVVALNQFDGLIDAEAELTLEDLMSFLRRHESVTVTIKLHELTTYFGASNGAQNQPPKLLSHFTSVWQNCD